MATYSFVTKDNARSIVTALREELANQNVFSTISVGNTDVAADGTADSVSFVAGTNVTITADASNDTITFAATDTTYNAATADTYVEGTKTADGTAGLMTGADKYKLDGIAAGAEVNQNAFSSIVIGATTIEADGKTDSFTITAGTNVTITADAANDSITITAADTTYTLEQDSTDGHKITFTPSVGQATEITIPDNDTTYNAVVASDGGAGGTDGLMIAADKEKLDGVATGAQVNVLEGVKVNGTALTATNKAVDITVTTGDTATGNIKVNGVNVTPYGLGTAAAATVETTGISSNTTTLATTAQVKDYVDTTVTSAYKAAGSLAGNAVASSLLIAANEGNVYNLSSALTLDGTSAALFVDGTSGDVITAGTNIAVVSAGSGTYKFDKMAGFVDLSSYTQTTDFGGLSEDDIAYILA